MNFSRRDRLHETMGKHFAKIDNEIQMLCDNHNDHDLSRKAWATQSLAPAVHTSTGNYTMGTIETIVIVNKTVAAATTVTLPATPLAGRIVFVKDGKGDAATNNITVQAASGNIDGAASQVIAINYGSLLLGYNGTQWNILAQNVPITSFPLTIAQGGTNSTTALNNNRLMISSSGAIKEHTAQTNGRVLIADSNGLPVSTGNAAINGTLTITGDLAFSTTSTDGIVGTTTNDSAASGNVGEYVESVVGNTNLPASGTIGDLTSISLGAGDWNVDALMHVNNQASFTSVNAGISTTSGNAATGLTNGSNRMYTVPSGTVNSSITISNYRMSLSGTTTVYFKMQGTYTGSTPQVAGRLSARRMR